VELVNIDDFRSVDSQDRITLLRSCLDETSDAGWFMEFGVYRGHSINLMASWYPNRTFYGFDSLIGLPEKWIRSDTSTYRSGHFATSLPNFADNVIFVEGFFNTSLPNWIEKNASKNDHVSFIHIDSDLYSSAKTILTELDAYIKAGTVIVFDELCDWKNSGVYPRWEEGEWKALCEWTKDFDRSFKIFGRGHNYEAAIIVE
jgi:hypothetical protein